MSAQWFVGISAGRHDSAVSVADKSGALVFHVAEERLIRRRHGGGIPYRALESAFHYISAEPWILAIAGQESRKMIENTPLLNSLRPEAIFTFDHHECHQASAFLTSPFVEAAIVTCDGFGDSKSISIGVGEQGGRIHQIASLGLESSLGGVWWTTNFHCGFRPRAEGTLMALAASGNPIYTSIFDGNTEYSASGLPIHIASELRYNMSRSGAPVISRLIPRRLHGDVILQEHRDLAASLQSYTERILEQVCAYAVNATGKKDLCLAGGVFYNCKANNSISRIANVDRIFVQPAAGDEGLSIGAALQAAVSMSGERAIRRFDPFLGMAANDSITRVESAAGFLGFGYERIGSKLLDVLVELLAHGNPIGVVFGRSEAGPRALGHRSILGDPRLPSLKVRISEVMKQREPFRPVAPIVRAESAHEWFSIDGELPYMTQAVECLPGVAERCGGVRHSDGTARVQTVSPTDDRLIYELLGGWCRTSGIPILMNTSFNSKGEPLADDGINALIMAQAMDLDHIVIEDRLFVRN